MSVIINGMEMPKSCGGCELSGTGVCKSWSQVQGYDMGQKRAQDCPLVPIETDENTLSLADAIMVEIKLMITTRELSGFNIIYRHAKRNLDKLATMVYKDKFEGGKEDKE